MIKIDENLLISDLLITARQLLIHPDSNILRCDYLRFLELNDLCAMDFYKMLEPNGIVIDTQRLERIIDKDDQASLYKLSNMLNTNQDFINNTFLNYTKMLDKINFYPMLYYDVIKNYSEKDFIDIILSYYATFGDKIYSIAKKYFDENRIHMGHPYDGLYGGFFVDLLWLESGYIFSCFEEYSSSSAASLVHELGHAIDAEMFIFPQQKNNNLFADYLCEVPSAAFELGFFDYLKKTKIDIAGAQVLNNEVIYELSANAKNITSLLKRDACDLLLDGRAVDSDGNEYNFRNDVLYGLGYYIAMHLNLIRKSSNKDYLKILNNIITSRHEMDLETIINMMGVSDDDFMNCKYIEPVIASEFEQVKKRYKHKG